MTLIELLVVVVIFMVITSITIFNYGNFNSSVSIQNLADDIALSVRKAQGYAIGVRGANDLFNNGYGVHFTTNELVPGKEYMGSNKSFVLFADLPNTSLGLPSDEKYEPSVTGKCGSPSENNECMEVLNIISADQISSITFSKDNNITTVPPTGTFDILFKRPNPEPNFCYRQNAGNTSCDSDKNITYVKIKISSIATPDSVFKIITISNNGQVSVSNNDN
jgi:type II secretory pathway pseudopilin PulG